MTTRPIQRQLTTSANATPLNLAVGHQLACHDDNNTQRNPGYIGISVRDIVKQRTPGGPGFLDDTLKSIEHLVSPFGSPATIPPLLIKFRAGRIRPEASRLAVSGDLPFRGTWDRMAGTRLTPRPRQRLKRRRDRVEGIRHTAANKRYGGDNDDGNTSSDQAIFNRRGATFVITEVIQDCPNTCGHLYVSFRKPRHLCNPGLFVGSP